MQKTVLITGGAGYIGSHIALLCAQEKYKVIIIDLFLHHQIFNPEWATVIRGDYGDAALLDKLFKEYSIDMVIHCGAFIEVGKSVTDSLSFYENNVAKTIILLNVMRAHNITLFIFSSSCAVYGTPIITPIPDNHPKNPISPYGHSKLMIETVLEHAHHSYGMQYICLRYFNAAGALPEYGLGEHHIPETHLIPLLIEAAYKNKPFFIFGTDWPTPDGTCLRDFVHVWDIAHAHLKAIEYLKAGRQYPSNSFNLGTGHGYSVAQMIEAVTNVTGKKIMVELRPRREGDPAVLVADASKAHDLLNWQPKHSDLMSIVRSAHVFSMAHALADL